MFLLKCPRCKNNMKYQPMTKTLYKKVKRCVYCGFSMNVSNSVVKKI